ncbi:hypothetical protein Avbf_09764 [Armadillidium vulgare]|nr:hypothetical protein Avbf_09764 [Armadillidium vulgare]
MQKLLYISNGVQLEIDRVIVVPLEILNRHCRIAVALSETLVVLQKYATFGSSNLICVIEGS